MHEKTNAALETRTSAAMSNIFNSDYITGACTCRGKGTCAACVYWDARALAFALADWLIQRGGLRHE
ncbi:MAG: hypothetical protein IK051_00580 [Rhodocyclaceae bacterium]|nr:hypothetical protein [Rhodocyclaceae bacterium]